MYKFRDYDKIFRQQEGKIFIEIIEINNTTKEEIIMKREHIRLPMPPLDVPCAYITVKAGATVPIPGKRFHSARIDIGLSYPCHPEQIDEVYEKVKTWVDVRMTKEYEEMTASPESKDNIEVV
ncbi:hypothetical protein [Thermoanaerobacter sp. A7A]|uniref:hypothetical protein n=1 Tax=Thermoanaerobacter sp. A7A TaxID=1350366 RepID=UPI0004055E7E|nr:hypothetical protein [Thermoanaerobacter sp. A7A]